VETRDLLEAALQAPEELERPLDRVVGLVGVDLRRPGRRASCSETFGLYFIVQDPSG